MRVVGRGRAVRSDSIGRCCDESSAWAEKGGNTPSEEDRLSIGASIPNIRRKGGIGRRPKWKAGEEQGEGTIETVVSLSDTVRAMNEQQPRSTQRPEEKADAICRFSMNGEMGGPEHSPVSGAAP